MSTYKVVLETEIVAADRFEALEHAETVLMDLLLTNAQVRAVTLRGELGFSVRVTRCPRGCVYRPCRHDEEDRCAP